MKIRLSRLIFVLSGALLLAGCHKFEATTTINANGSGELRMGVGFSPEERANMEEQNPGGQDFCNTSQTQAGVTIVEEKRGEETWCVTTTQFKDLDELRNLYGQRDGIQVNRLEISDGRLYYDVNLDTSSEESGFSALTEITWLVVLPGTPVTHNAEEMVGNTLTWQPAPKSGIVNLTAQSEIPETYNFPPCGAALIGLGVVFIHVRRRVMRIPLR